MERYYTRSGRLSRGWVSSLTWSVAETYAEVPSFGVQREADLNHMLKTGGADPRKGMVPRVVPAAICQ